MSESSKAVFLSYASQDVVVALRLCTALRAAGVEVWFDQDALVGGDAWDQKIRGQIGACALFIPVISANTQERREGYFRLEWHLAEDRMRLIAKGTPFIVPVTVDGTSERGALVPEVFTAVQWTRLPGGETPAAFVARVRKLLGGESSPSGSAGGAALADAHGSGPAAPLLPAPPSAPNQGSEVTAKNLELSTDVRLPLEGGFETFVPQRSLWRRALPIAVTAIVTALVVGLVAWRLWPTPAPAPVTRFSYRLPDGQTPSGGGRNAIAISPDGRRFVFNATGGLYLRSLDELEAHVIPGTGANLSNPVFSPDGQSVGYWQAGQLKRIAINGGAAVVICAFANNPFGATNWSPDGTILFGREEILRVPATGARHFFPVA